MLPPSLLGGLQRTWTVSADTGALPLSVGAPGKPPVMGAKAYQPITSAMRSTDPVLL